MAFIGVGRITNSDYRRLNSVDVTLEAVAATAVDLMGFLRPQAPSRKPQSP